MKSRIAIVGGSNVDIFATSALPLIDHDSNPGRVTIGYGGVGRNIAENLARLGQDALLLAPFGKDPMSAQMLMHTKASGVDIKHIITTGEYQAPYYISLNDSNGDMEAAVSDMRICDCITPAFLERKRDVINACDAVIVDTNIPEEAIHNLALNAKPSIFCDAVSTGKAIKLVPLLPHLFALKANIKETEALLGERVSADLPSLTKAANRFHVTGIPHVLITLGMNGAFYSANGQAMLQEVYQVNIKNTGGCGDAFAAAAFLGILQQKKPLSILRRALAAAAVTAKSEQAVSTKLSNTEIDKMIKESRGIL